MNKALVKHEEAVIAMMRAMEVQIQQLDAMRDTILPVLKSHEERLRYKIVDPSNSLPGTPQRRPDDDGDD